MAAYSWKGGSGDWSVPANWIGGVPNGDSADVTISVSGSYTVEISNSESFTADSVALDDAGAVLSLAGTLSLAGAQGLLELNAGTLDLTGSVIGGTIEGAGSAIVFDGGILDGVTYKGTMDLSAEDSSVSIIGGLTLSGISSTNLGTINLGEYSSITFVDSQTIDNAKVYLGGYDAQINDDVSYAAYVAAGDRYTSQTLTLGPDLTLDQTASYNILGSNDDYGTSTIINQGVINAVAAGGALYVDSSGFTNTGLINVLQDDALDLVSQNLDNAADGTINVQAGSSLVFGASNGTAVNTGTIEAESAVVTLYLSGTGSNAGDLAISNSTVNLYDDLTSEILISFAGQNDTLLIYGTLDNTGASLTTGVGSALAAATLESGATIIGGTIDGEAGAGPVFRGGILDNVNYEGTFDLSAANAFATIVGGMTVSGSGGSAGIVTLGESSNLTFEDTQTFDNATINLGGYDSYIYDYVSYAAYVAAGYQYTSQTLTLGPNLTIEQTGGYDLLGESGYYGYGTSTIVNEGVINAAAANGYFYVDAAGFINKGKITVSGSEVLELESPVLENAGGGTISVAAGSSLVFGASNGTAVNAGTIEADSATVTLYLTGSGSSAGVLAISDSTVNLYGNLTPALLASFDGQNDTLNIYGTLDNIGSTISTGTGGLLGYLTLEYGAEIIGGTIENPGTGEALYGVILDDVTSPGGLDLVDSAVTILGGLTVSGNGGAGTVDLGESSSLTFEDTQTFDNATINLGPDDAYIYAYVSYAAYVAAGYQYTSQTLTLGPNLTIEQTGGYDLLGESGYYGYGTSTIINEGVINAAATSGNFYIEPAGFTNSGEITVSGGETLELESTELDNTAGGTISAGTGSTLVFGASTGTVLNAGTIEADGATVTLYLNSTGSNTGVLAISNSTVNLYGVLTSEVLDAFANQNDTINVFGSLTTTLLTSLENLGDTVNLNVPLNNAGATLTVGTGSQLGQVTLQSYITIAGGTIDDLGAGMLFRDGALEGVTYEGEVDLTPEGSSLTVMDSLTAMGPGDAGAGTINLGNDSSITFDDAQTLNNVLLTLSGYDAWVYEFPGPPGSITAGGQYAPQTLTLSSSLTLDQTGNYDGLGGNYYAYGEGAIANNGTINAEASNGNFTVDPGEFTNSGTINVSNGDSLDLQPPTLSNAAGAIINVGSRSALVFGESGGTASNAGTISADHAAVTFYWEGTASNTGVLSISNSAVNLYGSFTTAMLAPFTGHDDTINIYGTLDNTGTVLSLGTGSGLGQLTLENSGIILGGTIENASSGLVFAGSGGYLDNVTIEGVDGLVAGTVSAPSNPLTGQFAEISWTDINAGSAAAVGPWVDEVFLGPAAPDAPEELIGTFAFEGTLAPGATLTLSEEVYIPGNAVGEDAISVKANALDPVEAHVLANQQTIAAIDVDVTNTPTIIAWGSIESSLQPPSVDNADWTLIWDRFLGQVGNTETSLEAALSQAAATLNEIGEPTTDPATLLSYELAQASGVLPNTTLADTTDIADSGTGLDLSLSRSYSASLLDRNNAGVFGDGWTFTYGIAATADASGNVYITSPSGTEFFTLQTGGGYIAQAGDNSVLKLANGVYTLTDSSGTVEVFRTDGQLGSITDSNGNTVEISYGSNGVISGVTSSNGQSLTFTTNAEGRITKAVDGAGQTTTYTYDSSGNHLLSVSGPDGVTSYSYSTSGNGYIQNALTQITNPDGTQQNFTYDSLGNLASQSGTNGAGQITYSDGGIGTVTETDANGNATTLIYDANGNLGGIQDAQGKATLLGYDANGDLTSVTTPGGSTYSFTYSSSGNLTGYTDPTGGTVKATYQPGTSLLTALTDQNGNTTDYSYNAAGDLTGITYDDGSGTTYTYSTSGVLTAETNALGQTTQYTYNASGELTTENFSDGTSQSYTYDSKGDLLTAKAVDGGVTSYTYNSAGELTGVTDPQGRVESYSYNANGQESQRVEPDGSTTNYTYNAAGQLAELTDGNGNLLVKYTYNAAGQLTGANMGNGASTSYAYDALGNVTEIQTEDASGTVTSQLKYTYNAASQPVTVTSLDGTWSYGYNPSGELTSAIFASTNASIPDQNLSYAYDAAGNRTETIFNGAVTNYNTNGLNQYTSANGTTYGYDKDGNLVSVTSGTQTTTYTYNSQNELISETSPSGTTTYQYDALGNQISSTVNGVKTDHVIDPLAISTSATGPLSSIAQVYNAAGDVTATYDYGNGLAAIIDSDGTEYYNTDATGNVTSLSGEDGDFVATYDYTPFGTTFASTGGLDNPFQYAGGLGIATYPSGFVNMRARYYDPSTGRFISEDTIGQAGGINLYQYVGNQPTSSFDPTGKKQFAIGGQGSFGVLFGEIGGNLSIGVNIPGNFSDFSNYQVFASAQVNASFGFGLYLGVGAIGSASTASGPLPTLSDSAGFYQESDYFDYGESTQVDLNDPSLGGGIPIPKIGAGAGVFVGIGGGYASGAVATPTFGEIAKSIKSLLGSLFPPIIGPNLPDQTLSAAPQSSGASCKAGGCPHFTTFDGLEYDFQGAGEFIAVKSTQSGNPFEVQMRIEPEGSSDSSVSIITQIAVQIGKDRVTFAADRTQNNGSSANPGSPGTSQVVWLNGTATTISTTNPVLTLGGGTVTEVSASEYRVALNTGEVVTIDPFGDGMGFNIQLPVTDGPGSIEGMFGADEGQANDFQLANGTVLQQPLTQHELYQQFADAWRVTDATSLLDYAPGQTTATFTDTQYPREILTLADFPPDLVAQAAALAAAAGITDPTLAADAEFDYITMGDPTYFAQDAAIIGGSPVTAAVITDQAAAPVSIGVLAQSPAVAETTLSSTPVTFEANLTSAATTATVIDFAVASGTTAITEGKIYFDAADFGGALPSGELTIAAGQTQGTFTVDVPNSALEASPDKWLAISVSAADPNNIVFGPTAETEVISDGPVQGAPANPVIELLNSGTVNTTLTQSGNDYTLNLGDVLVNGTLPALQFAIANMAATTADDLSSAITSLNGNGFQVSGTQPPSEIAGGGAYQDLYFQSESATLGSNSETLVLTSYDVNDSGYYGSLPNVTLVVEDTVVAPALTSVNSQAIVLPNARVGGTDSEFITITNAGTAGAASLDVTPTAGPGAVTSGTIAQLAAGAADGTDISVGVITSTPGVVTGMVTLDSASDLGNGVTVPALPDQTISVTGTVYREASITVTPAVTFLHVGATGTDALTIGNADPADGYSEGLLAGLVGAGGLSVSGTATGLVAAGTTDGSSIEVSFSTGAAGVVAGTVTLDAKTDGISTSGLGILDIGTVDLPVTVTINNYATAALEEISGGGTWSQSGDIYLLNLGDLPHGAMPAVKIGVLNDVLGPADLLSGSFSFSGTQVFAATGFGSFVSIAAGVSVDVGSLTLSTTTPGAFADTIVLDPAGSNASGYHGTLAAETLVVTGDVAPCFARGTRILKANGRSCRVEELRVGDELKLFNGETAPITWIGWRRLKLYRHPRPEAVQPVLFTAGALGGGLPLRDLVVSPDHAMFLDGHLIPAKTLINGFTIRQLARRQVTYYHIELDHHAVIFADGAAVESYLETGNRGAFENGGAAITLHPDFAQGLREQNGCAPLAESGPAVEAVRQRILDGAGIETTFDPALRVHFENGDAIIASRSAIPGEIFADPRDRRCLGVKIGALRVGKRSIPLDHPELSEGWHGLEPDGRWTNGRAVIPAKILRRSKLVNVDMVAAIAYPTEDQSRPGLSVRQGYP